MRTAKMRHCWNCGDELGVIESRHYDRTDALAALDGTGANHSSSTGDR